MLSQFNEANNAARWTSCGVTELTGIHGQPETQHRSVVMRMSMGTSGSSADDGQHEDYNPGLLAIQATHGHVITRDNYRAIVTALEALDKAMKADPKNMFRDKRETAEAVAKRNDLNRIAREKQEREQKIAAEKHAAAVAKVKALYPWAKQTGSNHANLAANLRTLLAQEFPGIAFRITSDSASMTSSVNVNWQDGPTDEQVNAIASQGQYGHFDGMTDSYNADRDPARDAWRSWMGSAKHVFTYRSIDPAALSVVVDALTARGYSNAQPFERDSARSVACELFKVTALPAGAVLTGIADAADDEDNQATGFARYIKLAFTAPEAPKPEALPSVAATSDSGIQVRMNLAKGGVEIVFPAKPDPVKIAECKSAGFRWSRFGKCWYASATDTKIRAAHRIAGTSPDSDLKRASDEGHRQGAIGMEIACGIA